MPHPYATFADGWGRKPSTQPPTKHPHLPHGCPIYRSPIAVSGVTTNPKCYPQPVQVTLTIPDDTAKRLIPVGKEPSRAALEALAIEGYRTQRLTESEVRRMLGFETRMQVHQLLAEHDVCLNYSADDLQLDIEAANKLHSQRASQITHAG